MPPPTDVILAERSFRERLPGVARRVGSSEAAVTWTLGITGTDPQSEALGINASLKIVGWSGASESDYNRHAVLSINGAAWAELNDQHFTHGLTSWVLQQANGISDTGVIVGLGTKSGSPRGFMLIPRVPGD